MRIWIWGSHQEPASGNGKLAVAACNSLSAAQSGSGVQAMFAELRDWERQAENNRLGVTVRCHERFKLLVCRGVFRCNASTPTMGES